MMWAILFHLMAAGGFLLLAFGVRVQESQTVFIGTTLLPVLVP
jgi:hypothetical protein